MMRHGARLKRRAVLARTFGGVVALSGFSAPGQKLVNADHGRLFPPRDVPALPLLCSDGSVRTLTSLTRGKATAVQLMYTECTTTCPIQAVIFQQLQKLLPNSAHHRAQLLSISINPQKDTVQALRAWLRRFQAGSDWGAGIPQLKDLPTLLSLFGKERNALENHTTQVQVVNQQSQIVWRSIDLPSAESVATALRNIAG